MKLTKTEMNWLKEIVNTSPIHMNPQERRSFMLYLAKAIIAAREV